MYCFALSEMQFIRGLRDADIREKLLQAPEFFFDKLVTKAITIETARLESNQLRPTPTAPSNSNSSNVNKLRSTEKFSKPPQYKKTSNSTSKPADNTDDKCFCCGGKDHKADTCKADKNKLHCSSCNKNGHVASVCMKGKRQKGKSLLIRSRRIHLCVHYKKKNGLTIGLLHSIQLKRSMHFFQIQLQM